MMSRYCSVALYISNEMSAISLLPKKAYCAQICRLEIGESLEKNRLVMRITVIMRQS